MNAVTTAFTYIVILFMLCMRRIANVRIIRPSVVPPSEAKRKLIRIKIKPNILSVLLRVCLSNMYVPIPPNRRKHNINISHYCGTCDGCLIMRLRYIYTNFIQVRKINFVGNNAIAYTCLNVCTYLHIHNTIYIDIMQISLKVQASIAFTLFVCVFVGLRQLESAYLNLELYILTGNASIWLISILRRYVYRLCRPNEQFKKQHVSE